MIIPLFIFLKDTTLSINIFLCLLYGGDQRKCSFIILELLCKVGLISALQMRNQDLVERLPNLSKIVQLTNIELKSSGFFQNIPSPFYFTWFISFFHIFVAFITQNKSYRNAFFVTNFTHGFNSQVYWGIIYTQ